jgi:hypothetical protein
VTIAADSEADAKDRFLTDVQDAVGIYEVVEGRLRHETEVNGQ